MRRLRRIVLVGHCGPDAWMLKRAVKRAVPDMKIATAGDEAEALSMAQPNALLLINRVLDGAFVSDSGVDLIARLAQQADAPQLMLISNQQAAQAEAVRAGARQGFGKETMRSAETADLLRSVVDQAPPPVATPTT